MAGRIQQEIRQAGPMPPAVEAHLNVQRTAASLREMVEEVTTTAGGLKQVEFNVLRILRGAGAGGATVEEIHQRIITPDAPLPAVLGALANRGLVDRAGQRRTITARGLEVLAAVSARVDDRLAERFGRLDPAEVRTLIDLLERLRP
jgi:DNA-binding MarR family transcriptional regulator